jgi:hypothetical protein
MKKQYTIGLAMLALVGLSACTSAPPVSEIPESISTARTPADHQRVAAFFAQKATNYDAEAQLHDKMSKSYLGPYSKGNPESMASHCRSLRDRFIASAKEARELAQAHRQLAELVK